MTTPTTPGDVAAQGIKSLRVPFVWALLGYNALSLIFTFFDWLIPADDTFSSRAYFADFIDLYSIGLPLVAVLIATSITPVPAGSKLVALVALAEYAFALAFGALTFLFGLGYTFDRIGSFAGTIDGLGRIVLELAGMAIAVLAAFGVFKVFTELGGKLPTKAPAQSPPVV